MGEIREQTLIGPTIICPLIRGPVIGRHVLCSQLIRCYCVKLEAKH